MKAKLSRREILKRAAVAGAATAVPGQALAQAAAADEPLQNLNAAESETLKAFVARLIPSDENGPGALQAGAATYIDRTLGTAEASLKANFVNALAAVDGYARSAYAQAFTELAAADQDAVLTDMERNVATGFEPDAATFFDLVLQYTMQGTFSDPHYGGNRDFIGWELIGYPGLRLAVGPEQQRMDADAALNRLSAYDLPMFDFKETDDDG